MSVRDIRYYKKDIFPVAVKRNGYDEVPDGLRYEYHPKRIRPLKIAASSTGEYDETPLYVTSFMMPRKNNRAHFIKMAELPLPNEKMSTQLISNNALQTNNEVAFDGTPLRGFVNPLVNVPVPAGIPEPVPQPVPQPAPGPGPAPGPAPGDEIPVGPYPGLVIDEIPGYETPRSSRSRASSIALSDYSTIPPSSRSPSQASIPSTMSSTITNVTTIAPSSVAASDLISFYSFKVTSKGSSPSFQSNSSLQSFQTPSSSSSEQTDDSKWPPGVSYPSYKWHYSPSSSESGRGRQSISYGDNVGGRVEISPGGNMRPVPVSQPISIAGVLIPAAATIATSILTYLTYRQNELLYGDVEISVPVPQPIPVAAPNQLPAFGERMVGPPPAVPNVDIGGGSVLVVGTIGLAAALALGLGYLNSIEVAAQVPNPDSIADGEVAAAVEVNFPDGNEILDALDEGDQKELIDEVSRAQNIPPEEAEQLLRRNPPRAARRASIVESQSSGSSKTVSSAYKPGDSQKGDDFKTRQPISGRVSNGSRRRNKVPSNKSEKSLGKQISEAKAKLKKTVPNPKKDYNKVDLPRDMELRFNTLGAGYRGDDPKNIWGE